MSLIKNIFIDFGHFKLDISKLSLSDKGIIAIVGPSGSGKTTFLKVLLGLQRCSSFHWNFKGTDLAKLHIEERRLGFVFQDSDIFPHMTVEKNMRFAGKPRHKSQKDLNSILNHLADTLDISHLLKQRASHLSGGERQRLAIANALISHPRILLLDEPFSCLDEERHDAARSLIKKITTDFNIPVIMVTHDKRDVEQIANQVITIENGKIVNNEEVKKFP